MFQALEDAGRTSRIGRLVLLAGVLGALAFALTQPASAQAATCDRGEFCMYIHDWNSGMYDWSGNDGNLSDDYFQNSSTNVVVDNNASALSNNGWAGAYDDVRIYDGYWGTGATACIPYNWSWAPMSNLDFWNDRVSSFYWVNSC